MSLDAPAPVATGGLVRVVGTGLLGASVGLALSTRGVDVVLSDPSRTALALARDVGAGRLPADDDPAVTLVVVAAPPDVTADVVLAELAAHPAAVVTDLASVKGHVLDALRAAGADLTRYVGSHPMAGRERSGPAAALPGLFVDRPWVIADSGESTREALLAVRDLAADLGAIPVGMDPREHDAAVAVISHVPQVAASLVAARLRDAPVAALDLSGQGLRDVTRLAAGDAALWTSILAANAGAVRDVLVDLRADLDLVIEALTRADAAHAPDASDRSADAATGALGVLARAISARSRWAWTRASTTPRSPSSRTSRRSPQAWWPRACATRRPPPWASRARGCATSRGSQPATPPSGRRSSPPTRARCATCSWTCALTSTW